MRQRIAQKATPSPPPRPIIARDRRLFIIGARKGARLEVKFPHAAFRVQPGVVLPTGAA